MKTHIIKIGLFIVAILFMSSCAVQHHSTNEFFKRSEYDFVKVNVKPEMKASFKTNIEAFRAALRDTGDVNVEFLNQVYKVKYDFYKSSLLADADRLGRKTAWQKEFLKLRPKYWDVMPITSKAYANELDLFFTAAVKELSKAENAGKQDQAMTVINSDAFMFDFVDRLIKADIDEFLKKMSNPVTKPKQGIKGLFIGGKADFNSSSTTTSSSSKSTSLKPSKR